MTSFRISKNFVVFFVTGEKWTKFYIYSNVSFLCIHGGLQNSNQRILIKAALEMRKQTGLESDVTDDSFKAIRRCHGNLFAIPLPRTSHWWLTQPSSIKAQRPAFILLLHREGLKTSLLRSLTNRMPRFFWDMTGHRDRIIPGLYND